jgi:hypothetical protein
LKALTFESVNDRGGHRRFFRAFALSRSRARSKKERKSAKKKERKKAKAPSAKEKSANSCFFLPPQWKSGFRAQSRSAGGSKGLE